MIDFVHQLKNYQFKHFYFKIKFAITILVLMTSIMWIFFSKKSHWNYPKRYDDENIQNITFFDLFYYNCTTFFTVGFGDFSPVNIYIKMLSILLMFIAYGILLIV